MRILLVLLLVPSLSFGGMLIRGSGGGGGDSYSDILFYHSFETSSDCTLNNADYSAGDATPTCQSGVTIATSPVALGTYSLGVPSDYDRMVFDISNGDIVDHLSGRIGWWVYITSVGGLGGSFVDIRYDASNYIQVETYSAAPASIRMIYSAGGTAAAWTTATNPLTLNGWHYIEAEWNQGAAGNDFELFVNGVSVGTNDGATGTWAGSPVTLSIGENNGTAMNYNMDQFYSSDDPARDLYAERNSTTSHP